MSARDSKTQTDDNKKRRAGAILRTGVAALAILGIGGALTTAAWIDNVEFVAPVTAGSLALQGRIGTTGEFEDLSIDIPDSYFSDLAPSETARSITVQVRNSGTLPATVVPGITTTGFATWPGFQSAVSVGGNTAEPLPGGEVRTLTINLNTSQMPTSVGGTGARITVTFTGTQVTSTPDA